MPRTVTTMLICVSPNSCKREQGQLNQGFRSGDPADSVLDTTTMLAGKIAGELQERSLPILRDEKTASDRMDAAFKGC